MKRETIRFLIQAILFITFIVLLGGGIYDFIMFQEFRERFLTSTLFLGSIIVMILFMLGVGGYYLLTESVKYFYSPRESKILLLAGIVLIAISAFVLAQMLRIGPM